ncbi:MAG: metallophosphoesterase [Bacteroidia bacterium]|nr:metallophosphoesterase [Bacteroidia bacterium]
MPKISIIHKSINRAAKNAHVTSQDISTLKWVIFSDHHRGQRDGADDFLTCEKAYIKALNYYYENGYTLLLLGDVEEFWENPLTMVLQKYNNILELEKKFFNGGRLLRIWGNHDDVWRYKSTIAKHLNFIFPQIIAHEAINLKLVDNDKNVGEILFIHGHQGTLASERWAWLSKIFVKIFWRNLQRIFKFPLSTPSNSISLKSDHDHAMYEWAAAKQNSIIICGHTHQPVFMSHTHIDELMLTKKEIMMDDTMDRDLKNEKLEEIDKVIEGLQKDGVLYNTDLEHRKPCYFNSGCCSFSDGDITGLEIVENEIKLIKWNLHRNEAQLKKKNKLSSVINALD